MFSFFPREKSMLLLSFGHGPVLLADFIPSLHITEMLPACKIPHLAENLCPDTLYGSHTQVSGCGKPFLMLSHPCFPQDEEPEVRMAENLISNSPPSSVVCLYTSCHSIALSCMSGWGPPAVMERCVHLTENIIFM